MIPINEIISLINYQLTECECDVEGSENQNSYSKTGNVFVNMVLLEINVLNVVQIILGFQIAKVNTTILFFRLVCLVFQLFVYTFRYMQMQC